MNSCGTKRWQDIAGYMAIINKDDIIPSPVNLTTENRELDNLLINAPTIRQSTKSHYVPLFRILSGCFLKSTGKFQCQAKTPRAVRAFFQELLDRKFRIEPSPISTSASLIYANPRFTDKQYKTKIPIVLKIWAPNMTPAYAFDSEDELLLPGGLGLELTSVTYLIPETGFPQIVLEYICEECLPSTRYLRWSTKKVNDKQKFIHTKTEYQTLLRKLNNK
jgi:hypothetical protein